MKKLNLLFQGKELSKEQMKNVTGGSGGDCILICWCYQTGQNWAIPDCTGWSDQDIEDEMRSHCNGSIDGGCERPL